MRKKQQNQRCGKWITARTNSPAKKENRSYPHSTSALLLKGTVAPSSPARRVATASDEESARTPGVARPTAGDSMQHRLASGKAPLKSNRQFRPMICLLTLPRSGNVPQGEQQTTIGRCWRREPVTRLAVWVIFSKPLLSEKRLALICCAKFRKIINPKG